MEKKNDNINRKEMESINSILIKLGYKILELSIDKFLPSFFSNDLSTVQVDPINLRDLEYLYE
jgi:hypothetical protein